MQDVPRLACPAWQGSYPAPRTGAVDCTGWDDVLSDTFYVKNLHIVCKGIIAKFILFGIKLTAYAVITLCS